MKKYTPKRNSIKKETKNVSSSPVRSVRRRKAPLPDTSNVFPMRLNKRMALLGMTTRRGADELIEKGVVYVNGKPAKIGMRIKKEDVIALEGVAHTEYVYLAYNKPKGVVTIGGNTLEKEIKDVIEFPVPVFPVGRLDKDSQGLIIMTNDGRVTDKLLNPNFNHEKEYRVRVDKKIDHGFLVSLNHGVPLNKTEKSLPAKIRRVSEFVFDIVLTEGKNRQIRKMCGARGYNVEKLERFRIMNVQLGNIKVNEFKEIQGKELREFLMSIGIPQL